MNMMTTYPRDPFGDTRDYALEARQIINGELALSPGPEHCRALLINVLQQEDCDHGTGCLSISVR